MRFNWLVLLWFLVSCKAPDPGQALYTANCTSCHNSNPTFMGPIGPALKGSSWQLVQVKTTYGTYPKGYMPKRATNMMPQFKFTPEQILQITDYINREH